MLKIDGICKVFGQGTINEKVALKDLDLHAQKVHIITIIGSTGAGKST